MKHDVGESGLKVFQITIQLACMKTDHWGHVSRRIVGNILRISSTFYKALFSCAATTNEWTQ